METPQIFNDSFVVHFFNSSPDPHFSATIYRNAFGSQKSFVELIEEN